MTKAEFIEKWKPAIEWFAEPIFKSDLDALLKQHAIEFAKHSCTESDTSEQRDKEWNEWYTEWITPK